jgi:hypothetical protein
MPNINMDWKQGCKPIEQGSKPLEQGCQAIVEHREGIFNVTLVFHGKNNLIIIYFYQ